MITYAFQIVREVICQFTLVDYHVLVLASVKDVTLYRG